MYVSPVSLSLALSSHLDVDGLRHCRDVRILALQRVEDAVEHRRCAGGEHEVVAQPADGAERNLEGHVLDDETTQHDADVQQDALHGVEPHEVGQLLVAHDREVEREKDEEGSETVAVVRLQHGAKHVDEPTNQRERVIPDDIKKSECLCMRAESTAVAVITHGRDAHVLAKGQRPHEGNEVGQHGEDAPEGVGAALWKSTCVAGGARQQLRLANQGLG